MTTSTELDPHRLLVAAHELAHAIGFRRAGIELTAIRVWGRGQTTQGHVDIVQYQVHTVPAARAYLAGLLAGREASLRWCEENGLPFQEHTCSTDLANFRRQRRTDLGRQVSKGAALADARSLVRTHWPRIVRLAPRLARAGHIATTHV